MRSTAGEASGWEVSQAHTHAPGTGVPALQLAGSSACGQPAGLPASREPLDKDSRVAQRRLSLKSPAGPFSEPEEEKECEKAAHLQLSEKKPRVQARGSTPRGSVCSGRERSPL